MKNQYENPKTISAHAAIKVGAIINATMKMT